MSKKRIGIVGMALVTLLGAGAAHASPGAARLLSPPMALPVPSGFLSILLLLTFFVHLVLVNVLLGSVILSAVDRLASASDSKGGMAFMPKVLALAVNFGVAPFLFLQVLYGHFLYPSILLMAVWWMFVAVFAMMAYYGLYVSGEAVGPMRRKLPLILSALLLLLTAFLLSNASTLMLRPDFWFRWFSEPHGRLLNTGDPTLFPRYLHILLASLAVGGLTMAWRTQWGKRAPESGREEAERRFRRGLDWFFYASLAQVPVGLLFLSALPPDVRGLFLGGDALSTAALMLAVSGLYIALVLARQGRLNLAGAAALGVILVMVCVRGMVRDAMLQPYGGAASPAPTALAMPHGQTAALCLFLAVTALVIAVLVWLGRVLFQALNRSESSEIREG